MANKKNTSASNRLFTLLVFLSFLLTLAALVLSAYLRLKNMGLGCENWPDCYAAIPLSEVQRGPVPATWAGVVHRLAATVLGIFIIAIAFMAVRGRKQHGQPIAIPLILLGLTIFLSVLGYYTPAWEFPAVTLGNLAGGMAMLALLWWLGQRSLPANGNNDRTGDALIPWARIGLIVVAIQIGLGAWTSANFAGLACPGLPGCNGDWRSATDLALGFNLFRELGVDAQGKIVTDVTQKIIHMTHRLGAVVTFLFIGWVGIKTIALRGRFMSTGIAMLAFLVLQVGLGVAAVLTDLPLTVVTAHNAVAALLLLAVVNLNHLLTPRIS